MNKPLFAALAAAAIVSAGCAASTQTSTEPAEQREYQTGSNIPKKVKPGAADGVEAHSREDIERVRDATAQQPRPGLGGSK